MTTDEFIKIVNGDYIDNPEYKKYYDKEDSKIVVQNVILDEHIPFNSEIKPFFKSVWIWNSIIRSVAFAFLELDLWIEFNGVKFIENVMFINKLKPRFSFDDCDFHFDIRFVDVESEEITFSECKIRYVAFFNGKVERLVFSDTIFSRYSFFRNIDCSSFVVYNSTFKTLEFSKVSGKSFEISTSKGVELQFNSTFSKDILFQISDVNVVNILYNSFINLGAFYFTGASEYKKRN